MDCNWNNPGADPARGPTVAVVSRAVASYGFDSQDRALIVSKAQRIANDGFVRVKRDGIETTTGSVATNLRDMHYGKDGRWCAGPVKRDKWADDDVQGGLVYCGRTNCIVIFTVCGNVARIDFSQPVTKPEPEFRFYDGPQPKGWHGPDVIVHHVPEPSTLLLSLLALAVIARRP
jgi:hypothetical protein